MKNYSKKVFKNLKERGEKVAFAESITGGLLSGELVKNAGASTVFNLGVITYSPTEKVNLLKVDPQIIDKYTVVSSEVAVAMTLGLKELVKANWYVAITGNAGPTFEKDTSELCAYVAVLGPNDKRVKKVSFKSNKRKNNLKCALKETYLLIEEMMR